MLTILRVLDQHRSSSNNNNGTNPNLISEALAQLFVAAGVEPPKMPPPVPAPASANRDLPQLYGFPNEESWKHTEQARAILSNLIGPNGEQLTSTDPYNTTVSSLPLRGWPCY